MSFDVDKIRRDFPLLCNNPDLIYFDNAATTQTPNSVLDAINYFYSNFHCFEKIQNLLNIF